MKENFLWYILPEATEISKKAPSTLIYNWITINGRIDFMDSE